MSGADDCLPYVVATETMHVLGVEVQVHQLSNGARVIDSAALEQLLLDRLAPTSPSKTEAP